MSPHSLYLSLPLTPSLSPLPFLSLPPNHWYVEREKEMQYFAEDAKCLIFHSPFELANESATISWMPSEDTTLLSGTQRTVLTMAQHEH